MVPLILIQSSWKSVISRFFARQYRSKSCKFSYFARLLFAWPPLCVFHVCCCVLRFDDICYNEKFRVTGELSNTIKAWKTIWIKVSPKSINGLAGNGPLVEIVSLVACNRLSDKIRFWRQKYNRPRADQFLGQGRPRGHWYDGQPERCTTSSNVSFSSYYRVTIRCYDAIINT